ncbi:SDR family oxidoreductase [Hymenobacter crusticola]|uniref:Short-chain dehydrogenase n=1 Tax=Hymenobacter crusticola TaxID=1770526 RepID=A0A243WBD7_9BACT|nr:SDR family oxidoreductase [Hymenobacter crusticola]OUJ72892.1 short-chain dehydrogenase [Hymenobacter crusticola]
MQNAITNTDLLGKRALVTGGSKGIGKAIAEELARAGAEVIISARTTAGEDLSGYYFIAADLTKPDQVAKLQEEIAARFGGLDILINNVGGLTTPSGGFSTLTDELWESELQLNLLAAVRLDRLFVPDMIAQKSGVIIHISSVNARQPLWNVTMAYGATKAALNSYSKNLSMQLASKQVRVLTVSPGATRTAAMENFIAGYAAQLGMTVEDVTQQLLAQMGGIPMGRMAEPEEVASLVHFLVSPSAAYLTGANYAIDGGALQVV